MNAEFDALAQANHEITSYTWAIARGDLTSLDAVLGAAERRRSALQAELAQLDGRRQA